MDVQVKFLIKALEGNRDAEYILKMSELTGCYYYYTAIGEPKIKLLSIIARKKCDSDLNMFRNLSEHLHFASINKPRQ